MMGKRCAPAGAIVGVMLALAAPAAADSFYNECFGGDNASDEAGIAAATACINSGRYPARLGDLYHHRASIYHHAGNFDRAIADYSEGLRVDAVEAQRHYFFRGKAYAASGDVDRALADYAQVIRINPNNERMYLARGATYLHAGALPKALADFDKASALSPWDPDAALWLDLAAKRSKLPSRLPEAVAKINMSKWPAPIIRLYLGQLTPEAVMAAAADGQDAGDRSEQTCDANFFIGEQALLAGSTDDAKQRFRAVSANCSKTGSMYEVANAELAALGQRP